MPLPLPDLPADHLAHIRSLEPAYLASDDPILQSGFHGGPERWRAEREPILEAITSDGGVLDIGCANGYLLQCLVQWGAERGLRLNPYGVDIGPRLIDAARARLPAFAGNFWAANAWDWRPTRRFRYVYTLRDCVPIEMLRHYVTHLLGDIVQQGGRLIVGDYGSRSQGRSPLDVGSLLRSYGLAVAGESAGGEPVITRFAWVDKR